jgi:hypothetical protein
MLSNQDAAKMPRKPVGGIHNKEERHLHCSSQAQRAAEEGFAALARQAPIERCLPATLRTVFTVE